MPPSFLPVEITSLTVAPLSVRTVDPFRIATGEVQATRSALVRVRLVREGVEVEGLGEGACLPPVTFEDQPDAVAAVERAIPVLQGRVIDSVELLSSTLDEMLLATPVARAAVEVAILDGLARLDGLPLWRWLSGETTAPQPRIETDMTLPILSPARMAELAGHWWAMGFRAFKLKVGRRIEEDLAALKAIGAVIPAAHFQPDANAGFSVHDALTYAREAELAGLRLSCFEQPCATLSELMRVAAVLPVPVIADESVKSLADLDEITAIDAADGVNLKVAKLGSLLACLALGRKAKQRGMPVMVGGMVETVLGMTAASHLVAALGGVAFCDLDTAWLLDGNPFTGGYQATREDGEGPGPIYLLPETPGLGVSLA